MGSKFDSKSWFSQEILQKDRVPKVLNFVSKYATQRSSAEERGDPSLESSHILGGSRGPQLMERERERERPRERHLTRIFPPMFSHFSTPQETKELMSYRTFSLLSFREPSGLLVQFLHAKDLDATAPQMARHGAARAQGGAAVRRATLPRGPTLVGRQGKWDDQIRILCITKRAMLFCPIGCVNSPTRSCNPGQTFCSTRMTTMHFFDLPRILSCARCRPSAV